MERALKEISDRIAEKTLKEQGGIIFLEPGSHELLYQHLLIKNANMYLAERYRYSDTLEGEKTNVSFSFAIFQRNIFIFSSVLK